MSQLTIDQNLIDSPPPRPRQIGVVVPRILGMVLVVAAAMKGYELVDGRNTLVGSFWPIATLWELSLGLWMVLGGFPLQTHVRSTLRAVPATSLEPRPLLAEPQKGSGLVVRSTLRAVPATSPDLFWQSL